MASIVELEERQALIAAGHPDRAMGFRKSDIVSDIARTVAEIVRSCAGDEVRLCAIVERELAHTLKDSSWIWREGGETASTSYRRDLLYEAADGSFSVGRFLWPAGQTTSIHDHRAWCVMGCVCGTLESQSYLRLTDGTLTAGSVDVIAGGDHLSSRAGTGDIHRMLARKASCAVSIHVYGCKFSDVIANRYAETGEILSV